MGSLTSPISAFDENTRQNLRDIPQIAITGSRGQAILPKTGFLARIHVHVSGTQTIVLGGGTAALDVLGPYNMFNRVRCAINGGKEVYSVSGPGAHWVDSVANRISKPNESNLAVAPAHAASVYNAPTAAGANLWEFGFTIPIAPNDDEMLGGFIVQTEAAQSTLGFDFNPTQYSLSASVSPVLTTGAATASFVGNITALVETFDIPPDRTLWPPVQALHIITENTQTLTVGDNTVDLLKDNIYLQILHHLMAAAAPSSTIFDRMKLAVQRSVFPYDIPAKNLLQLQRYRYGRDLPAGLLINDFFYQGKPNYGSFRDVIAAMDLTEFQSVVTITTGTVVTAPSVLTTISRMLEPLKESQVSRMG